MGELGRPCAAELVRPVEPDRRRPGHGRGCPGRPGKGRVCQDRAAQGRAVQRVRGEDVHARPRLVHRDAIGRSRSDADTDDDDWPTRYSWLEDDETDEAAPEAANKPDPAEDTDAADATDVTDAAATVAAHTVSPDTVPAKTVTGKPKPAEPAPADAAPADAADAEADSPDDPVTADDAIVTADSAVEPAGTPATAAAHEDTGPPPTPAPTTTRPQAAGAKLVTVIPGVPRYHDPDCILIRFMDEDDIARKSIPEAQAANCTPCAACQPEG